MKLFDSIQLPYTDFKINILNKKYNFFYQSTFTNGVFSGYLLTAPGEGFSVFTEVITAEYISDFEANYKEFGNVYENLSFKPTRVVNFHQFDYDLYHKTFKYSTLEGNTTNIYSESFNADVYLYGGIYDINGDINSGDYLEFCVTDEDNVLGYGAGFILSKFVETEYITENKLYREIKSDDATLVPTGLYLTIIYHCASINTPDVTITYLMRK